jgi:hypothetical protein
LFQSRKENKDSYKELS